MDMSPTVKDDRLYYYKVNFNPMDYRKYPMFLEAKK